MADTDYLAEIARELITRIRDDDPEENGRWLAAVLPDPADWFRLAFILGALVPDDRTWTQLTAWTWFPEMRAKPTRELRPHGTVAALRYHETHGERPCEPCLAAGRQRKRDERARKAGRTQPVDEAAA